jgi:hypothetical protein
MVKGSNLPDRMLFVDPGIFWHGFALYVKGDLVETFHYHHKYGKYKNHKDVNFYLSFLDKQIRILSKVIVPRYPHMMIYENPGDGETLVEEEREGAIGGVCHCTGIMKSIMYLKCQENSLVRTRAMGLSHSRWNRGLTKSLGMKIPNGLMDKDKRIEIATYLFNRMGAQPKNIHEVDASLMGYWLLKAEGWKTIRFLGKNDKIY